MSSLIDKYHLSSPVDGVGMDLGHSEARIIHLTRANEHLVIQDAAVINAHKEGTINDQELTDVLGGWLKQKELKNVPVCSTLPSSVTTENILYLSKESQPKEFDGIVNTQAKLLSKLSDEEFAYDYQPLDIQQNQALPLLMMFAREELVEEQYGKLRQAGLNIRQMTSHGLAAVNGFLALNEPAAKQPGIQILLMLEADYGTLSILRAGRLLSQNWLSYGVDATTENIRFQEFQEEYQLLLERWHEAARAQGTDGIPQTLWITGEGALNKAFRQALLQAFPRMSHHILGVPHDMLETVDESLAEPGAEGVHPELCVAYGLAVQSLGKSAGQLSLLPSLARWQQAKERQLPYLVTAVTSVVFGLFVLCFSISYHIKHQLDIVISQTTELNACLSLAPKLREAHKNLEHYQKMMIPIAEVNHHNRCYLEALGLCDKALNAPDMPKQNWGIYFADEFSLERSNRDLADDDGESEKAQETSEPSREMTGFDLFGTDSSPSQATEEARVSVTLVKEVPVLKYLVVGGITPLGDSRYKVVKEIQTRLEESRAYHNVDDYIDYLSKPFRERYFVPWLDFLKNEKNGLKNDYTVFFLRLPIQEEYISEKKLAAIPTPRKLKKQKN